MSRDGRARDTDPVDDEPVDDDGTDRGESPPGPVTTPPEIRRLLDAYTTEFLVAVDRRGELRGTSRAHILGYGGADYAGQHIAEHMHPDDLPVVLDLLERARNDPAFHERITARARHRDGSWRVMSAVVIAVDEPVEGFEGAVVRARDITEELEELEALRQHEGETSGAVAGEVSHRTPTADGRFLSLAEAVPMGIMTADARGWVVFCNEAATRLFNMEAERMLRSGWQGAVHPDDLADVVEASRTVVTEGRPDEVTFRIVTGLFQRWAHARFVPMGDERSTGWIATVDDVTERRRAESRLAHLATHDSLTKLPNRVLLDDRLRQACGRLRRDLRSVSLLFVDLDGFKEVNDNLGHAAGDRVLIEVARRLRSVVRDVDTIARIGGDEFAVICEALEADEADEVCRRITDAVATPIIVGDESVQIGASVGLATADDPDLDVGDLLGRADQAMYRVKHQRKTTADAGAGADA